jgi:hypothetical protein
VFNGQIYHLRERLAGGVNPRRGRIPAASKTAGRLGRIENLESYAARVASMLSNEDLCNGPGFDAAVFGYLVAVAFGHMDAYHELRAELADLGLPVPPEQYTDPIALLRFLIA